LYLNNITLPLTSSELPLLLFKLLDSSQQTQVF
jgi:hypothetical protein